jgi:hypothetical protein
MKNTRDCFRAAKKSTAAAIFAILPMASVSAGGRVASLSAAAQAEQGKQPGKEQDKMPQGKFFCKVSALTQSERIHHVKLTEKLLAMRSDAVPTDYGYELQFDPNKVSITELTDWVVNESRCCPFFDFHIDLEHSGRLLCLRLTGPDGIKPFIEAEFRISQK